MPPDQDLLCIFYLVVAIGSMNCRKASADMIIQEGQTPQRYYQKTWSMLPHCLAVPNVSTVQVLILHVSQKNTIMFGLS